MAQRRRATDRAGFTLPEVLVAVTMVGVMAAVVLPTVIGQVSKGEVARVVQDLQSVEKAAQMFRSDVGRWPGRLEDLAVRPAATATAAGGSPTYGTSGVGQWDGPYLARGEVSPSGVPTGSGGTISNTLGAATWGSPFFTVTVTGLSEADAALVDQALDGAEANAFTEGKVRYDAATSVLVYYAVPLK